jgi:DNA-binding HxlR family transcriptional regulator
MLTSVATAKLLGSNCAIARSLGVLGERWTLLVLREAFLGATRFSEFRDGLDIAPDVLAARLSTLVEFGVLTREPYREPGTRGRVAYLLTPAGRELELVLAALQEWGHRYLPVETGPTIARVSARSGLRVHIGFTDELGHEVPPADVRSVLSSIGRVEGTGPPQPP